MSPNIEPTLTMREDMARRSKGSISRLKAAGAMTLVAITRSSSASVV